MPHVQKDPIYTYQRKLLSHIPNTRLSRLNKRMFAGNQGEQQRDFKI